MLFRSIDVIRFDAMDMKHGGEKVHPHHAVFHIHRIKADDINDGILEPQHIDQTTAYASFREALAHFCTLINVEKADDYFPGLHQGLLNFPTAQSGNAGNIEP